MPAITTRKNLDHSPVVNNQLEQSAEANQTSSVTRAVTLARCLRCGFEWLPRVEKPAQCARCRSTLWNVPRAQQLPGKPAPTRKGKPRGRAFVPDDPRHSSKIDKINADNLQVDKEDS